MATLRTLGPATPWIFAFLKPKDEFELVMRVVKDKVG